MSPAAYGHDGFGISQYKWIKSDSSPAIGGMVGGSDSEPFLMVSNLINGTYNFTLMVTNSNGKINTDNVTVTVKEDPYERLMVEVYVDTDMYSFTEADLVRGD
uniref:PKD domain-containing protein n=1 Tax=Amphimedon queenslandica TaxID=400682 RepID=A0A1X7TJT9_AMPQE